MPLETIVSIKSMNKIGTAGDPCAGLPAEGTAMSSSPYMRSLAITVERNEETQGTKCEYHP